MIGFRRRAKLGAGCAIIAFGFGGLTFIGSGLMARSYLGRMSARAQGRVVAMHANEDTSGSGARSVLYKPEIEFTTPDGKRFTFQSGLSSSPPQFKVGETVKIRYDPGDPARAETEGMLTFGLPYWLIGAGLVSLVLSVVCVGLLIIVRLYG